MNRHQRLAGFEQAHNSGSSRSSPLAKSLAVELGHVELRWSAQRAEGLTLPVKDGGAQGPHRTLFVELRAG